MQLEILSKEQIELLPLISKLKREYYAEVQSFLINVSIEELDIS